MLGFKNYFHIKKHEISKDFREPQGSRVGVGPTLENRVLNNNIIIMATVRKRN